MTNQKKIVAMLLIGLLLGFIGWVNFSAEFSAWVNFPTNGSSPIASNQPAQSLLQLTILFRDNELDEGEIVAAIFDDRLSFQQQSGPWKRTTIKQSAATPAQWIVSGLEPGSYAIAAFVDLNGNGKLDKNLLGMPLERYGFSNNARGKLGPPTYEECRIQVTDSTELEIELR